MKHLKLFQTEAEYTAYKNSGDFVLPNVSYAVDNNTVKYNQEIHYDGYCNDFQKSTADIICIIENVDNYKTVLVDVNNESHNVIGIPKEGLNAKITNLSNTKRFNVGLCDIFGSGPLYELNPGQTITINTKSTNYDSYSINMPDGTEIWVYGINFFSEEIYE